MYNETQAGKTYLRGISAIYLLLGPACNMSCRHCTQIPIKNTLSLRPECGLSNRVIQFIQKWLAARGKYSSRIYFWGGEPLLYWESIKRYILLFESQGIFPRQYMIFSNGLLLTKEIADFCNRHRVMFTMSYDAPDPLAVRNAVPTQENVEAFLTCEKRCVNFVFNALNCDPVRAFAMLEEKFPETYITMGFINIISDIPKDIYTFRDVQIERALDMLADDIVAGHDPYGNRYNFFIAKFSSYDTFQADRFRKRPFPPCAPGAISLSIRFNGDIVLCHNDNTVVANVEDSYMNIQRNHLREWKKRILKKCFSCPVLPICRNRCPIAMLKGGGTEYDHCEILRRFYGSAMRNREKLTESEIKEYLDLQLLTRTG